MFQAIDLKENSEYNSKITEYYISKLKSSLCFAEVLLLTLGRFTADN